jgi:hypothetical protein
MCSLSSYAWPNISGFWFFYVYVFDLICMYTLLNFTYIRFPVFHIRPGSRIGNHWSWFIILSCSMCVTIDGVWIGEWIYWPLIHTTQNYTQLQRHHWSPQITIPLARPFPACCVLSSHSLAMASNSGNSLGSCAQVLSSQPPIQNSTELTWLPQLSSC